MYCINKSNCASVAHHAYGLAQDCGNSIALAMELPHPCAKPLIRS